MLILRRLKIKMRLLQLMEISKMLLTSEHPHSHLISRNWYPWRGFRRRHIVRVAPQMLSAMKKLRKVVKSLTHLSGDHRHVLPSRSNKLHKLSKIKTSSTSHAYIYLARMVAIKLSFTSTAMQRISDLPSTYSTCLALRCKCMY